MIRLCSNSAGHSLLSKTEARANTVQRADVYRARSCRCMAQELGSSQASDLAPVVPIAISQCVKPSCKDRSEHLSAASKSVEREDLQGLFVTTLEATTFTSTTSSSEGSKAIYDKVYTKPSRRLSAVGSAYQRR